MKRIKANWNGIFVCLLELLVGILLLISPAGFTSGIIIAFGVVLVISGLGSIIQYFRTDAVEAAKSRTLLKGLVELLCGGFCMFKSEWFVVTFPVLTVIYGVVILVSGLGKIQWTVDMIRLKKNKWYLAAISAAMSIVCGLVIIRSPFHSTAVLWLFTGISLIVGAVFDAVALCFEMKGMGKAETPKSGKAAASTETEEVSE